MLRELVLAGAVLAALTPSDAAAIVLFNLANSANQSDPGTGVPWTSVAKVSDFTGGSQTGSAVYLGDGYLLTANHVTMNPTVKYVTFDNSTFYEIDSTFNDGVRPYGKQVATNVDMAVIKLTTEPMGQAAASLLTSPGELSAPATLIGWGVGRDPSSTLGSANVDWGNGTTTAKRWGENVPRAFVTVDYQLGSYQAIATITGGASDSPAGLGDSEAGLAYFDSGGGLFQQLDGDWYLIGVNAGTDLASTVFGPDQFTGKTLGSGNYFGRVSSYDTQIIALVPEPGSGILFAGATSILGVLAFMRRRHIARPL